LVPAAFGEANLRSGDEIFDRGGHQNFVRFGEHLDALGQVDSDAADVAAA
jgi:hypothetical protein